MDKRPTAADEVSLSDQAKAQSPIAPPEDAGAGVAAAVVELNYSNPSVGSRYRWMICALLFFATTVNYMDRQVLAVLSPKLKTEIGWTDTQYGNINAAFSAAYAVGLLFAGGLLDKFGVRVGYPIAMALWGLASISHAFVHTIFGFGVARVFLGLFEAGNFPAAMKTVAEWFPRKERALSVGLFNAGSNVGAILAPLLVPIIAIHWGWRPAFCVTGIAELIWICFWLSMYKKPEDHPRVSSAELKFIRSDPPEAVTKIPWARLFPYSQTWAFAVGKFLTDPVWWLWLFWAAPYLNEKFHVDIKHIGPPLIVIYILADGGSIGGGWIASLLIRAGCTHNMGRKLAMLICGICVVPVVLATKLDHMWAVVFLIGLAAAAHQGFSANLFALAGDLFPRRCVGSVVGIGGMCGAISGIVMQLAAGRIVDRLHTYLPLFIFAGSAYLLAVLIIQFLSPRLKPIDEPNL
jgi:ACS family hexuronate transporter-like MFS transporter